ncbi:MAG: hypothetical protein U9N49_10445 [Campylobacterota bacterium]|nr:hypothetical protein [Campylobacterota bacterium]
MPKFILLAILLMSSLFAVPFNDDVVDEAKTISIIGSEQSSSRPTRDVIFNNGKVNVYKDKLSLKSVKREFIITITDAFHLPNTLVIKRGDTIVHKLQSRVAKDIGFAIEKSKLNVGDKVIISTSENVKIVDMDVIK